MTPLQLEREKRKLTKAKAAELCGVDRARYGRLESMASRPSPELADRIAKALENAVTRDQLLFPRDYMNASVTPEGAV
jgi:transcriptional regulator with XRE-family HTH domain